jgi:alpha-glucan,water dikinase
VLCRFVLANDVLDGFAAAGEEGMAFLFTWLRMSSNKILTWARRANYQSKVCQAEGVHPACVDRWTAFVHMHAH